MTPDERELINGLFDRMRGYDLPQKDRDAEALINQAVRATPDAPYMLVQSVLVQEQALEAANARVQELEARVRELEGAQTQQSGGSFLGGLFGGGGRPEPERRASSVPAIGSRAQGMPSMFPSRPQAAPETAQPASGGFMRSAMATAAGVAGGMLLAEGIRNMMGGNSAQAQHAAPSDSGDKKTEQAQADEERNVHEADYDSSHNDSIDWGGDLDI
ncbi:MAG TPA: DUF2076 domain-containing protein [Hyphomicrobiaceae bacterium]|jgi:hypothetical protein|nr:DUF2076 domain-containing protein [Hyphomicrobiaceae bacterium]